MRKRIYIIVLLSISLFICLSFIQNTTQGISFFVPKGWPKPVYSFKNNRLTAEKFELGKKLFYDPVLSKDSTISCESCHLSYTAFSHPDHKVSHGILGLAGTRNAPSLVNMAWAPVLMWDGKSVSLEEQATLPITNPVEMNSELNEVFMKLQRSPIYRKMFFNAYGDSLINKNNFLKALAMFTSNLVSYHSKYDSVIGKIGNAKFTESEKKGYELFKLNCSTCHNEPLFTDHSFRNNGLPINTVYNDLGRMMITHKKADSLKFRVPTLRNIEFSAPYFHDGRVNKLKEALQHYVNLNKRDPELDPKLKKINITKEDVKDLTAFLRTLTDKYYLYNANYRPNR